MWERVVRARASCEIQEIGGTSLGGQEVGFRRSLGSATFYDGYVRRTSQESGQSLFKAAASAPESRRATEIGRRQRSVLSDELWVFSA